MSPYNTAKSAVINAAHARAMGLRQKGIRVNEVCASLTRTGMMDARICSRSAERFPL